MYFFNKFLYLSKKLKWVGIFWGKGVLLGSCRVCLHCHTNLIKPHRLGVREILSVKPKATTSEAEKVSAKSPQ